MENKKFEEVKPEEMPFVYKGYAATISYNRFENNFYGEVEGIRDVIAFSGSSVSELESEFKKSVDEYLDKCKQDEIEPSKQFTGDLLLQIPPNIHCRLSMICDELDTDIHEFVGNAVLAAMKGAELSLMNEQMMRELDCKCGIEVSTPWFELDAYNYPLLYKGYGAVMYKDEETDDKDMLFEGYLLGEKPGDDLYCFTGKTIDEAIVNFQRCVDDIIESNAKDGIDEKPPFDGNMTIKLDPRVQYLLALFANARAMSEEEYIVDSLYDSFSYERAECEVCEPEILEKIISQKEE